MNVLTYPEATYSNHRRYPHKRALACRICFAESKIDIVMRLR
jgi:hypothetical protein